MTEPMIFANKNQVRRMLLIFENIGADKASKARWEFRSFEIKLTQDSEGEYNILILNLFDMDNNLMKVEIYRDGSYKYFY